MVPPVRLYREGVLNEKIFRIFLRNSRFPLQTRGDTRALTAAVRLGEKRLLELFQRFGRAVVLQAFERLNEQTAEAVKGRMRTLFQTGTHRFSDVIESDGQGNDTEDGAITNRHSGCNPVCGPFAIPST